MGKVITASFISGERFRLVKERSYGREHVPAYDRIGGNMEYRSPVTGYDSLYQTLSKLPKKANWLLWLLMEKRNSKTNIAVFIAESNLHSKDITIAYKELRKHDLVIRTRKQHYLLNPNAFIPKPGHFEEVLDLWNLLTKDNK